MRPPERVELLLGDRRLGAWCWPGDGPTLVMLPGAGNNGRLFGDLAAALAGRRAVAIDPPGIGDSEPGVSRDLGRIVEGLAALAVDAFEPPAIWVGHSWGGKVSAILGGRHPELAAAALLIDPSPGGALAMDDDALDRFAESIWDGRGGPWPTEDAAIDALRGRRHYRAWTPSVETSLRADLVATPDGSITTRSTLDEMRAEADATLRFDYAADIAALRCPTLYLVASESRWWQALSNDEILPIHAERVEIEGQHLLHVDQPAGVAAEITRFLAEHGL